MPVIGEPAPVSLRVETFGTGRLAAQEILALVQKHFDLTPAGMIVNLGLPWPISRTSAAYGHFGRYYDGRHFPWEAVKPL
jgi:S-adenosylmethionine synthetase